MGDFRAPASGRRLELARRIYDAIVAGDLAKAMAGAADEIEWRNPAEAVEPGTRRGTTAFADALGALLAQFDYERLEILDSVEHGDALAVRLRVVATGRASGARIDEVFGQVFRFDGERVTAFEWSPDPSAALKAVHADRWPGG